MSMIEDYTIQCNRCEKIAGWQPTKRLAREAARAAGWVRSRNICGITTDICPDCNGEKQADVTITYAPGVAPSGTAVDMLSADIGPKMDDEGRMM